MVGTCRSRKRHEDGFSMESQREPVLWHLDFGPVRPIWTTSDLQSCKINLCLKLEAQRRVHSNFSRLLKLLHQGCQMAPEVREIAAGIALITKGLPGLVKGTRRAVFLPRWRFSWLEEACLPQPWKQSWGFWFCSISWRNGHSEKCWRWLWPYWILNWEKTLEVLVMVCVCLHTPSFQISSSGKSKKVSSDFEEKCFWAVVWPVLSCGHIWRLCPAKLSGVFLLMGIDVALFCSQRNC